MTNNNYKIDRQRLIQFVTWKLLGEQQKGLHKIPKEMRGVLSNVELPLATHPYDKSTPNIPDKWDLIVVPARANRTHRILITCKCGIRVPSGRLHQHVAGCIAFLDTTQE